jgi:enoyl-CoA hydratase/carnithine racemase
MSIDMWEALPDVLDAFEHDPHVRVVVMKGAGEKAFISGADISEFEHVRSDAAGAAHYEVITDKAMAHALHMTKPVIAMIRGYCIGGGLGVALSCDLRIATEQSRFGIPAAKLGVGYRYNGVQKLVDVVGPSAAKEIFFTARQFNAAEAHAMGLVNRVVSDGELEGVIREYCAMIAANAPLTIMTAKRIIGELTKVDGGPDVRLCERLVEDCFASADYQEGRRAFMEKRKPVFTGR